jgi:uncharacterized cupin superfamily protein
VVAAAEHYHHLRDCPISPGHFFVRPYHEVALILEGEVEVELEDGTVLRAGPGDILDTPKGSSGFWRSLSPVRKIWAIYEE